ncbi:hypothetical protein EJB05_29179, partial [Eragrostis curvula]
MEAAAEATPPSGPSSSAVYSSWLMLGRYRGDDEYSRFAGDGKTAAACFTSDGLPIAFLAHRRTAGNVAAARPLPGGRHLGPPQHGRSTTDRRGVFMEVRRGHADTPGLLDRYDATGLLRRGREAFVVAELMMAPSQLSKSVAELLLLRSGKWSVKRAPIGHGGDKCRELPSWRTETVVPVGDRLLCWVDLGLGLLFSDVFDDKPELRYVSLPATHSKGLRLTSQNVCATAGGMVKFVNVFNTHRCGCSGGSATKKCPHSCYACIVKTWTLNMVDMVWVMDATIDATELYALDAWKGLPRVQLECPVVSIEDPMVIGFVVCEGREQWMILVDTRSRTVQAVSRGPDLRRMHYDPETTIPSRFSSYLNSYPRGGSAISLPVP